MNKSIKSKIFRPEDKEKEILKELKPLQASVRITFVSNYKKI
jgi:hypothetical protein